MPGKRGGRGGARQGTPGKAYPNRSDMTQAPRAVPGQTYGQAGAQLAAQRAVPMAGPGQTLPQMAPQPVPLNAPTNRPNEPVTAGAPSGPGPNTVPNMPMSSAADNDAEALLRAIHAQYPTSDVERLLAAIDAKKQY